MRKMHLRNWSRLLFFTVSTLPISANASVQIDKPKENLSPLSKPPAQPNNKNDISFELTSDNDQSLQPKPFAQRGEIVLVPGQNGQALRTGAKDSYLYYKATGAVQGDEGTMSSWVRPQWDISSPDHHTLWSLNANGRFRLYRQGNGKDLVLLFCGKDLPDRQFSVLSASMAAWKINEWHHVGVTWRPGEVRLYLDGELKRQAVNPNLILPEVEEKSVFSIGDSYNPAYPIQPGQSGRPDTDIDVFRLYSRALSAGEIGALAGHAEEEKSVAPPPVPHVVVPKTGRGPKIDGNFSFDEWRDAAGFSGFIDLQTGLVSDRQTGVLLTYDDTNLYIATYAPVPEGSPLKRTNDRRDGPSYGDDSIEIHLDPGAQRKAEGGFQFIGNSNGAILDTRAGDTNWNGKWNYHSTLHSNWRGFGQTYWVTELSIPFSELGRGTPRDGEQWAANFARTWYVLKQAFTSWTWSEKIRYGDPARLGILEFREKAPAFNWMTLRDISAGQPMLEGTQFGTAKVQLTISSGGQALAESSLKTDGAMPQFWMQQVDLTGANAKRLEVTAKAGAELLYSAQLPYQLDTQEVRVFLSPIPSQQRLVVDVDPLRFRRQWGPGWSMQLRLVDKKRIYQEQRITIYKPPLARTEFALKTLAAGDYEIQVAVRDAGNKLLAKQNIPFHKPVPPVWLNNKIGVTEAVLKPWTPIEVKDNRLKMWGREYDFAGNAFPQQVSSAGSPLLNAPVRLTVDGSGLQKGTQRTDESTGARVVRSGSSASGNWNVAWKSTAEFDGMLWYEVTLTPIKGKATLQSLSLDIPMRADASGLYHVSNGNFALGGGESGATPQRWNGAWKQVLWLGNEKAGLCWFAESDQYWNLKDRKDALQIEREAGGTVAKVRLVTQPLAVTHPITYRFGLQATPTRPMPTGWRGWQWASGGALDTKTQAVQKNTHAYNWWQAWSPYISSPFDVKPEAAAVVETYHKNGIKVIPYQALMTLNEKAPDFNYFKAEWLHQPQMNGGGEAGQQTWFVNVKGSYQDYFLYALREMVRGQKWDGVYFDFAQGAVPDLNEFHGSGYVDEKGVRHPTYDILAQREFHKRLWAMLQQELGVDDPIVMVHNSACLVPPVHSFANVFFDGEQFRFAPKVSDDYTAVLSRETWRSEFLGVNFGGAPMLLPELSHLQTEWLRENDVAKKAIARQRFDAAIDTMLLYPLVHGGNFVPAWLDLEYLQPLFDARRAFDLGSSTFHGYWDNAQYVTLTPLNPDVLVSLYSHADRIWVVAGNWTAQEQSVKAQLNIGQLSPGLKATAVANNIWKEGAVTHEGDDWSFSIPAKSIRIIELHNP